MPPDEITPGTSQHWLARATGHLTLARQPKVAGVYWEDLSFHAQQAAELGLKAVHQHNGVEFRFTHNLEELITGLKTAAIGVPPAVDKAVILTRYAVWTRYPGLSPPVTQQEHEKAVRLAEAVVEWARAIVMEGNAQ